MLERVRAFAHALRAQGVADGERVAVLAKNQSALLEAHFAVPMAGGVLCALNTRLHADEIAYIVGHCGPRTIIVDAEFVPLLSGVDAGVRRIVVGGDVEGGSDDGSDSFAALLARYAGATVERIARDEETTISINYTSGTTGRPKGVMYTYRGAYLNALAEVFHANLRSDSTYLWTLPMFHCNGWCFPWAVTAAGATHVCLPKVDPARILALIRSEEVTHLCAAPTVLIAIVNHPGARPFDRPLHVTTAGAPPSPTIIAQMEALGATITHVYGLTETYGPITACEWQAKWNSAGDAERARFKSRQGVGMLTLAPDDVRVVDSDLRDVPADGTTQGEVVMRGNNVMKGYYEDPEATARAFKGGWFHSGDIAVQHSDGYIELQDRAKDIIISGGENISTIQVEKAVVAHPAVLECAVVAIPDERWGEVPKAFVTLKPGASATADEIVAHCRTLLPGFKVPKAVAFGELPKTSTGKIQKFVLREREWAGRERRIN
jgi:acyl-CoA synthetase (AMP-forming)/AMP-acid ligase II